MASVPLVQLIIIDFLQAENRLLKDRLRVHFNGRPRQYLLLWLTSRIELAMG
jgi:hypothetical protein